VNQAGLDFYDRLVDELLANGIKPVPTLFHWDTPQALEDEGGWTSRATAELFVDYVDAVATRLGDRVDTWITHNEPWVVSWIGHAWGIHAPGRTSDADAIAASHHLLLSHGWAADALRPRGGPDAQVGISLNLAHVDADSDSPEDLAAARRSTVMRTAGSSTRSSAARYPVDMPREMGSDTASRAGRRSRDDLDADRLPRREQLLPPGRRAGADGTGPQMVACRGGRVHRHRVGGLSRGPLPAAGTCRERLRAAGHLHPWESGAAFGDVRSHDGRVRDPERQAYIAANIDAVGRAVESGVPVRGYFVWSLLDNFEWAEAIRSGSACVFID